mgnify:CR=1 FL=1
MGKFIEDDWTGEELDLSQPFYFVNGEITSKDNLTKETITVYYDYSENEYNENEVKEFNNVEDLIDFLNNEINVFEDIKNYLIKENYIISSRKYESYAEDYRKILDKIKGER